MWKRIKQLPAPFQIGSLSSVLMGAIATLMMIYFYLVAEPGQSNKYLLFIVIGLAGTARSYFRFRRIRTQNDLDLLDGGIRPSV